MIEQNRNLTGMLAPMIRTLGRLPATGSVRANRLRQTMRRLEELLALPDGYQQFFAATQIGSTRQRRKLLDLQFASQFEPDGWLTDLEAEYFSPASESRLSPLDQFMLADLSLNLPSQMLTRLDRASMAHSVEARVPFLSHRMVDWALTVPTDVKLRGRTGKYILRQAIEPWLPQDIIKRPKQGFQIPMANWLRGPFGVYAQSVWNDSGAASLGYVRAAAVEEMFAEHRAGTADHSRFLYALTVFGLWWSSARSITNKRRANAAA